MRKSLEETLANEAGFKGSLEDVAEKIVTKIVSGSNEQQLKFLLADKEVMLACGYGLGRALASYEVGFKTAMTVRFYENMIRMKSGKNCEYLLLKPVLTADLTINPRGVKPFHTVINILIEKVRDEADLKILIAFVDTVFAYHKYCGGR